VQKTKFAANEERLLQLRERMIRMIGIHTVNVLIERAIWEASQKYPELSLIDRSDDNLSFAALEQAYADRPQQEIDEAFSDLISELLLIMARLLGREMAERLSEELQARAAEEQPALENGGVGE